VALPNANSVLPQICSNTLLAERLKSEFYNLVILRGENSSITPEIHEKMLSSVDILQQSAQTLLFRLMRPLRVYQGEGS